MLRKLADLWRKLTGPDPEPVTSPIPLPEPLEAAPSLTKLAELEMAKAVLDCYREGITDPAQVRARQLIARNKILRP